MVAFVDLTVLDVAGPLAGLLLDVEVKPCGTPARTRNIINNNNW